jgi:hypothetical protein
MPLPPSDPRELEIAAIDWAAVRASARRRLRARMGGFSGEEVDDAVEDVVERYVRFIRQSGPPHTPEGFLFELVRCVAANNILRRQRERLLETGAVPTWVRPLDGVPDEDEVMAEYARIMFQVKEYFQLKKAGCVELANVKSRGESLKAHAAKLGCSYFKLSKDWERCKKLILAAMRANRLRIEWLIPRPKRKPHA